MKYQHLDPDGIVAPGLLVKTNDIIVNKHSPSNTTDDISHLNAQEAVNSPAEQKIKSPNPAIVDKVMISACEDDQVIIKTLLRETRRPELGDKFSSRHGQKGVVGVIVAQEDMPFNGARPQFLLVFDSSLTFTP